jgi:hypothetical protein
MENNRTYFERRAAQERAAMIIATGKAREAHRLMAEHYEELASAQQEQVAGPLHAA